MDSKNTIIGLIAILAVAGIALISGCIGDGDKTIEEINKAGEHVNSGFDILLTISYSQPSSEIKQKLDMAENEHNIALSMLNSVNPSNDYERELINYNKKAINNNLFAISINRQMVKDNEKLVFADSYVSLGQYDQAKTNLNLVKTGRENSKQEFIKLEDSVGDAKSFLSNSKDIPTEQKEKLLEAIIFKEKLVEKYIKNMDELIKFIDGYLLYVEGLEYWENSVEYDQTEEWEKCLVE